MQEEFSKQQIQLMQEQQQRDLNANPNSVYADTLREDKVTNIISQINPDELMTDIEHRIRGDRKNPFTKEWESSKYAKKVSERLISNYVSFLGSILNQNTSFSNFSSGEINNLMNLIVEYIRDDLTDNAETYEIKGDYDEMTRIGTVICMTCFAVFKRAQNGMEARRIFSALKVHETLTQKPKSGLMEDFKFW